MSERGYIRLDRGALNHEFFRRKEYSEFEAWVWLLTEAAWKPRVRRVGEFMVNLDRGQLGASVRFLAEIWSWSKSKVARFLDRLKAHEMITTKAGQGADENRDSRGTDSGTGVTVITICNYEKYQGMKDETGTPANSKPGQSRDSGEDNTKEIKTLKKEVIRPKRTKHAYSEEFDLKFWEPYPKTQNMSKQEAWREWEKLDPDDRLLACKAIEPYRRFLQSKPNLETIHACRFLSKRRFDGFNQVIAPVFDVRKHLI